MEFLYYPQFMWFKVVWQCFANGLNSKVNSLYYETLLQKREARTWPNTWGSLRNAVSGPNLAWAFGPCLFQSILQVGRILSIQRFPSSPDPAIIRG